MKLEKRRENRVILSVSVQYKVFQLDQLEKDVRDENLGLKAALQNVSLGGLQVVSPAPFRKGDILEIQLDIPGGARVRSVAKVAWCEKDGSGPDYRSGIQFIPVYEDDLRKLVEFLK
ncbi:MAG TPA: PilZ domain-containing protein, partial [bacterium]|nr:PilZ domain-containing protein [bacterium]